MDYNRFRFIISESIEQFPFLNGDIVSYSDCLTFIRFELGGPISSLALRHPFRALNVITMASVFDIHNQYASREMIQLTLINTIIFLKLSGINPARRRDVETLFPALSNSSSWV